MKYVPCIFNEKTGRIDNPVGGAMSQSDAENLLKEKYHSLWQNVEALPKSVSTFEERLIKHGRDMRFIVHILDGEFKIVGAVNGQEAAEESLSQYKEQASEGRYTIARLEAVQRRLPDEHYIWSINLANDME